MNRSRLLRRTDGLSLLEAVACMAVVAAVAVPVGASLTLISKGPDQREQQTGVTITLESTMERICAMDFDEVPLSPDGQTPANITIDALVAGQRVPVEVYVTPHGFLEDVRWRAVPFSLETEAAAPIPSEPWELVADSDAGTVTNANVKLIRVSLQGQCLSTLLVKIPTQWRQADPSAVQGVEPEIDDDRPLRRRYRGSMRSRRCWAWRRNENQNDRGNRCWPPWRRRRRHH